MVLDFDLDYVFIIDNYDEFGLIMVLLKDEIIRGLYR